jgi:hypothetical protein
MPTRDYDSRATLAIRANRLLDLLSAHLTTRRLVLFAFVTGCVITLGYRPFSQLEVGDTAIYDYLAQSILRGQMPYRDAVEMKSPGSVYLSAAAMLIGRLVGINDVIAVRLLCILLTGLFAAVLYLVAESYLQNRRAAIVAFLFPLMVPRFLEMLNSGTQPKSPMMIFGLLTLLCIRKDRPFAAGVCSMLSCICWQPGLLFAGTAFLMFSRYLTSWRDLRVLKLIGGSIIPLAILAVYFHLRGALWDLWSWTIVFNYSVFAPESTRTLAESVGHILRVTARTFRSYLVCVVIGVAGGIWMTIDQVRTRLLRRDATAMYLEALLIPVLVYALFCLVNFQSGPDLIPFFPFIGIGMGWLFVKVSGLLSSSRTMQGRYSRWAGFLTQAAAALMLLAALARGALYRLEGWTFKTQQQKIYEIGSLIGPDDRIYVHGTVEVLVILNRPNANPYIALDGGADLYIASRKPGGFDDVIREIESAKPKLVFISRLRNVRKRAELEKWVDDHYYQVPGLDYDRVYLRKPGID